VGASPVARAGHRVNDALFSFLASQPTAADVLDVRDFYSYDTLDT